MKRRKKISCFFYLSTEFLLIQISFISQPFSSLSHSLLKLYICASFAWIIYFFCLWCVCMCLLLDIGFKWPVERHSLFSATNALFSLSTVIFSRSCEIRTLKFDAKMDKYWAICCLCEISLNFSEEKNTKCWQPYAFSWGFFSLSRNLYRLSTSSFGFWNCEIENFSRMIISLEVVMANAHVFRSLFYRCVTVCVFSAMNDFIEIVKFKPISCATNWEKLSERPSAHSLENLIS